MMDNGDMMHVKISATAAFAVVNQTLARRSVQEGWGWEKDTVHCVS